MMPVMCFGQNVNIPDANFKAYLVGNTAININGDGEIQISEAIGYSGKIECDSLSISDLTGIEAFSALTELECNNNKLTSLDLSNNTALTDLRCWNNKLTSLDLSKNTDLTDLWCYDNQLNNLNVSQNTDLTDLICSDNQLTSLDLSKNTALTDLDCNGNKFDCDALKAKYGL